MTIEDFSTQQLLKAEKQQQSAELDKSIVYRGLVVRPEKIYLDKGYGPDVGSNPFKIDYPFKGVFVRDASDSVTNINVAVHDDSQFQLQNSAQLKINDGFDFGLMVARGFLTAPKQPGKWILLYFVVSGNFKSGSQLSITSGGVSITTGSGMSPQAAKLVGTSAVQLLASDASRKKATLQVVSGGSLFISGNNSLVTDASAAADQLIGYKVGGPGSSFEFTSQGECWAIADANTLVSIQTES